MPPQLHIPILGIKMPNMGMTKLIKTAMVRQRSSAKAASRKAALRQPSGLAAALFTGTQQRVLGLLFGQPDRSFFATEIIGLAGAGSGAVQRELARLTGSGLITVSKVGNQKHYQANAASPVFAELSGLMLKTTGLAEPLRIALAPLAERIAFAFVYGSVAKGGATAASDIDLMIVSDDLSLETVFTALAGAELRLGRKINPAIYTRAEFRRRRAAGNAFLTKVLAGEKIVLIGSDDDLT